MSRSLVLLKALEATVFAVVCVKDASKKKKCSKVVQSKTQTLTKQPSGSDLPVDCSNLALEQGATPDPGLVPKLSSTSVSGAKLSCEIELDGTQKIAEVYALVLSAGTLDGDGKVIKPKYINEAKIDSNTLKWEKCSGKTSNSYVTQAQDLELNKVSFGWTPDESEFGAAKSLEATVFAVVCVKDASKKKKCSKVVQSKTQTLTKPSGSPQLAGKCDDHGFTKTTAYAEYTGVPVRITADASGKTIAGTVSVTPEKGVSQDTCSPGTLNYLRNSIDLNIQSVSFSWKIDDSLVAGGSINAQVFAFVCFADIGQEKKCSPINASHPVTLSDEDPGPVPFNHRVRRRRRPRKSRGPAITALVTVIALVAAVLVFGIPGGHFLLVAVTLQ
ncbi:hypothetical protein MTO96_001987 [Rhipicephalus appendiculatus]